MDSSVPLNSLDTESEYLHQSILFHIAVENTRRACITYYDKKIEQKYRIMDLMYGKKGIFDGCQYLKRSYIL